MDCGASFTFERKTARPRSRFTNEFIKEAVRLYIQGPSSLRVLAVMLEQRFGRTVSRVTLNGWVKELGELAGQWRPGSILPSPRVDEDRSTLPVERPERRSYQSQAPAGRRSPPRARGAWPSSPAGAHQDPMRPIGGDSDPAPLGAAELGDAFGTEGGVREGEGDDALLYQWRRRVGHAPLAPFTGTQHL
jgi:transposase-like protein